MKEGNSVIRVKFNKKGLMKFIGHLDTQRYFQRVIRRAGIDAAYSEGFSPHQIISFAQPLSVGVESNAEYFDLEVRSYSTSREMIEKINKETTEEAAVLSMSLLPSDRKKAMAEVAYASYSVRFRRPPGWDVYGAVQKFNSTDSVKIMKKTKRSEKETELKDLVRSLSVREKGGVIIDMTVSASSGDNLKPGLLIRALRNLVYEAPDPGEEYPGKADLLITREELYSPDMKTLLQSGEEF